MRLIIYLYTITLLAVSTQTQSKPLNTINNTTEQLGSLSDVAFVGGHILNPSLDIPISNATILVSNGKVVNIQPSTEQIPKHIKIVDISNKWVIPGLIDGHIHLAQSGSAFTRPDTIDATAIFPYEQDQKILLDNTEHILKRYLALGITSVFDLGGPSEYVKHYKKSINTKHLPDVYVAGTLLSPMSVPALNVNGATFTQVTSADAALEQVKQLIALDTHIIKVVWSQETGLSTEQLYNLYLPAIKLAHQHNKIVAVHVEDLANAKMAIKAGGDILVHGVISDKIDDEFIQLAKLNNVTYMPTLSAYNHYFQLFKNTLEFTPFQHQHGDKATIDSFKRLMLQSDKTGQMFQLLLQYS
ncbi:amidohydrolase family protein [Pseudoalteromonas sp. S16_S37]|uniref:amidohydrolase family protein n=1 Tax=Pseudoalteromonas sp. S16_S37 TaxID=2720228 RepID=UPI00168147AD|nr:amidohydrolase family protein [Pseudoalteromonas sp. S16_S37]MBD1584730.1 amidohydrolase family protein [Pseudoalteromonas sp. S16_S37]